MTEAPENHDRGFAGQPKGLGLLFFVELWERFSYYGMRALLTVFMVAAPVAGGLGLSIAEATRIYGNYTMAVYMLSIPGGYLADAWLGARASVLIGGAIIALGHFALAVPYEGGFIAGLTLVALGTGLFKPNISAMVGSLYGQNDPRRDAGFSIFYMGINIGAFISPIVTGFLAQSAWFKAFLAANGFDPAHSWHWGFGAAGVGMTIGLILFAFGSRGLPRQAPSADHSSWTTAALVISGTLALMLLTIASDRPGWEALRLIFLLAPIAAAIWFATRPNTDSRRLAAVAALFIAAMIFWALFEQSGTTIALFADRLTRNEVAGFTIPSAWYQSLNPIFVILLAPVVAWIWLRLGDRQPSSPVKFALGLIFLALSFALMVPAALLTFEGQISPLWLVGLFFLFTIGELMISPVGLSTMTKLAPPRRAGLILGVWFLAAAWGNKLAGILGGGFTETDASSLSQFFLYQSGLVAVAAVLLIILAPWIKALVGDVR